MLEASRFTIEKKIKPMLRGLRKDNPNWLKFWNLWVNISDCGFCKEYIKQPIQCKNCPLRIRIDRKLTKCYNQFWYSNIKHKLRNDDLTVYGDIIDVWYCYENLEEPINEK